MKIEAKLNWAEAVEFLNSEKAKQAFDKLGLVVESYDEEAGVIVVNYRTAAQVPIRPAT